MVLTKYFLNKAIQKLRAKASDRPHQYRSMDKIKNILIVCDSKDWDIVRSFVEMLKGMNKNVNTMIFASSGDDVPTWVSNYLLVRADKDTTFWGFPEKSVQEQFYALEADIVINFSDEKSDIVNFLVLNHPATFKAGIKRSENSVYDFAIIPTDSKDDLLFLFEQLINYLQSITSK